MQNCEEQISQVAMTVLAPTKQLTFFYQPITWKLGRKYRPETTYYYLLAANNNIGSIISG